MASVEEIERKQKAMQPLLEQIAQEKDADRIQQLGRQIAEMAQELAHVYHPNSRDFYGSVTVPEN